MKSKEGGILLLHFTKFGHFMSNDTWCYYSSVLSNGFNFIFHQQRLTIVLLSRGLEVTYLVNILDRGNHSAAYMVKG